MCMQIEARVSNRTPKRTTLAPVWVRGGDFGAEVFKLTLIFLLVLEPDLTHRLCVWIQKFLQVFKNQFDIIILLDSLSF